MSGWVTRLAAASLLVVLSIPGGARASDADYYVIRDFDVIALRREFGNSENATILKWQDPLRFYVTRRAPVADTHIDFLRDHIADMSEVTGLEMTFVEHIAQANFRVLFIPERDFRDTLKTTLTGDKKMIEYLVQYANCVSVYGRTARGALDSATVIIPVDGKSDGDLRRCILEETTQSMGLVNDAPDVGLSLFNSKGGVVEDFNDHDRTLLRLLYHPEIKPGMSRDEAIKVARQVLPEVK